MDGMQRAAGHCCGMPWLTALRQESTWLPAQGAHAVPADVTTLAGCGCILDSLLFTLADAGTCVGIPAPYYPAFDNDLKVAPVLLAPLPWLVPSLQDGRCMRESSSPPISNDDCACR
jgi:hypothetical protein